VKGLHQGMFDRLGVLASRNMATSMGVSDLRNVMSESRL
jgi:hypothetical protein